MPGKKQKDAGDNLASLRQRAETGDVLAQEALARALYQGKECLRDPAVAVHWWREAAKQDNLPAMRSLALALLRGEGARQDFDEATYWYRRTKVLTGQGARKE
jgi:TPR repeat protein